MKTILLTASSSNEKSLNNFLKLFKENFKNNKTNIIKIGRFLKNKKIVTVLKSPHVNKAAQEQFEKREKILQIFLTSKNFNKTIITTKKILNTIFRDIKFTIKYLTNNNSTMNNALVVLKNTNFKIYYTSEINTNKSLFSKKEIKNLDAIKFKTYLNIFSHYGNIILKI
jgi:ribosomal protein S10